MNTLSQLHLPSYPWHLPGAGNPQKLRLGMQIPLGASGCWCNAGVHWQAVPPWCVLWGYLFHKSPNLPCGEKEAGGHCSVALCSAFPAAHIWGQAEQPWWWLRSVRAVAEGYQWSFRVPGCSPRTCLPPDLTFAVSKTCTNL